MKKTAFKLNVDLSKNMYNLALAVFEQLEAEDEEEFIETLQDVANYGANSGFNGFIYYHETSEFFKKNRRLILAVLNEESDEESDYDVSKFVKSFKCLKGFQDIEIMEVLLCADAEVTDSYIMIANCLTWYALETVAYHVISNLE